MHTPEIGQRVVPARYRDGRLMTQDGQVIYRGAEYYCRRCEALGATLEAEDLETILAYHDDNPEVYWDGDVSCPICRSTSPHRNMTPNGPCSNTGWHRKVEA